MRADVWLVECGKFPSRKRAQDAIAEGRIFLRTPEGKERLVTKPSIVVAEAEVLIVRSAEGPEFVSRAGKKLFGALQYLNERGLSWPIVGKTALDIGTSTGGFSDCLLQTGAARIIGVDVGHGQLNERLRGEPRLSMLEGVNARYLNELDSADRQKVLHLTQGELFSFIVIDVSFISLKHVLPAAASLLSSDPDGRILALVKPQFEVGPEGLGKNGIVQDTTLYRRVEENIHSVCRDLGLHVEAYFPSLLPGADGNREFFIFACKQKHANTKNEH